MWKKLKHGAIAALLAAASLQLHAAKISAVRFEQQGANPIPTEMLSITMRLRPGMAFSRAFLDEDIKSIYATGKVSDVVAEVKELPGGMVEILLKIKPSPLISAMHIKGNVKFSTKDLQKCFTVTDGDRLNGKSLNETIENLRKFYTEKGYNDVRIAMPAIVPDNKGGVIITITIAENLKHKVNSVNFEGATVFSPRELRSAMFNNYSYWNLLPFVNDFLNHGLLNRKELELDKARLRELYHEKGYLDFAVEKITLTPTEKDPEFVDINIKVSEGKRYKIEEITINGNRNVSKEELGARLTLQPGMYYSRSAEQQTLRNLSSLYDNRGYADLLIRPRRRVNYPESMVSIDFEITEGRKFYVNSVIPVGNTATKAKVLLREMAIQPGDPVSRRRLEVSRQRLMGMGYFKKVEVEAVNADDLNAKDIRITVEEKPERYNFRIGAGASDISTFFGMAEISTDNFDITNPRNWFYGGGQRMRIQGIYGIDNAGFNVDFIEPWLFDLPLRFELSSYMNEAEYDDWSEQRIGVRTSLRRKIFDDFTSITAGYKFEIVRVHDIAHSLRGYFKKHHLDGTSRVSQFSMQLARDTRDNMVDPTEGYNVSLFGAISPMILGGSDNFYRLEAKGSYFVSFFDKAIVAMVGAKFGVVSAFDRSKEVPVFERYFMGGSNSIRGFEYRSVGPTAYGRNVGGTTMLLLTAEMTHPIWGPLRGAAFVDAGNAWRTPYTLDFSDINIGIGYGIRLKLPMIKAPLKLDVAYPILRNQDNVKRKFRVHFNVGFTF